MRIREKRSSGSPIWLFFELLVVFLGVWGAFFLNNYQDSVKAEKKTLTIYHYFIAECAVEKTQIDQEQKVFDSVISSFFTAYKNGELPDILGVPVFFTSSVSPRVWEAVLTSGGTEVMDFETIRMIDQYETEKLNMLSLLSKGETYGMQFLLMNMERPKSEFYNLWTKQLRPQYQWYLKFLQSIRKQYKALAESNEALTDFLQAKISGN
ncbi:MAG: hypothetical protein JXA23_05675 [Bacteroidales bacterium]|nr:hypothetical protein [Bacteroidales bacterium]